MKSVLIKSLISFCPIYLTILFQYTYTLRLSLFIEESPIITKIIPPIIVQCKDYAIITKINQNFFQSSPNSPNYPNNPPPSLPQ